MSKHYYAGMHYLSREFSYNSVGWTVFVFNSAAERDAWVVQGNREDRRWGNASSPRREAISRDTARRIAGSHVKCVWDSTGTVGMLEEFETYYNPHYWG